MPSNATYGAGQDLSFTVNWSEAVDVTGTPRLALTIGSTTRYATYVSGSGTAALVFKYTVQSGDGDPDGVAVGSSVDLNGGTIAATADATYTVNAALNSVGSTAAVLVVTTTAPGAPTGVSGVAGNTQATVSFSAPASDGGAAITGYTVTSSPAGGTDSNAGSTSLSHVITGLTNGTSYTFTVTATNSIGTGSASSASSAVTPATTPTVTSPISASVGNTSATLGGNVTATGGASLTAVGVVYSVTSANNYPQLSGTGVTNLTGTAATGVFTVSATGLTAGTAYSYAAYATNSVGTTYSSVGTFTTTVPTPTLTFTTPSTTSVAVGATRTNAVTSTLSGGSYGAIPYTSSDTSKATVNATSGVVTGLAVGSTTITATQAAASGFNATTSTSYTLTVTIGTPTITAAPTATGITYGQTLASSTLSGGTANVAGTFTFTTTSTAPNAGSAAQGVTFTPTDTTNYTSTTAAANVTVAKATPTLTWTTPSAITYGTTLSATQLNATSSLAAGSITYSPASGTTPSAGTQTLTATFTPTDTANYNTATGTVSLTVNKATPTITWATPSAITYGTALSATQLNASGSVTGAIVYSPASGTTPSAGTQTLTATFTPTDTANYTTATGSVSLVVGKATPTLTWATPSAITYGTTLSATQLNATSSLAAGTIVYSPASGTTPSAGTQTLTATFTPTDTANYNTATGTISLTVNKATPTLTWVTPATITYGTALSATQLNATSSLAAGTIVYIPASGTTPSAGPQTLTATFTPTDTANYNTATGTVSLTVNKATPTITWATPSTISFGTALSATQLNATANVAGAITYSPASGAILSVGTQTLSASFTPADSANYNSASAAVSLNVIVAVPGSPTAITATTANGEATITFTAPGNPGSSAITGYTIRATATDGSIVTVNATGSPAKITSLTPGKSYRFTVTANNSAGSSESSTVTDALTISLVNQTISFAAPADRASNSGSFALSATASSGLPVTFTLVSGPGLLAGNVVDLTGATGPIKLRASQAGNATYAAAPEVEVTFAVTAGPTNVVFSQALGSGSRVPAAELGLVLPGNGQPGSL
ncbi:MAG: hypothetical protein B9S26_09175, partial [Opitutia bacterium Tous-C4FEB]